MNGLRENLRTGSMNRSAVRAPEIPERPARSLFLHPLAPNAAAAAALDPQPACAERRMIFAVGVWSGQYHLPPRERQPASRAASAAMSRDRPPVAHWRQSSSSHHVSYHARMPI